MDDTNTQAQDPLAEEEGALDQGGTSSSTEERCEEYLAGWKRAQADYKNLQRETNDQRAALTKFANERLLRELLPALDQFSLVMQFVPAMDTLPEEARHTWEQWLTGVKAIQTLWQQAARGAGLEPIPIEGVFDPQVHEAVSEEASADQPEGHILRVLTPGWILHGKVLQAARVVVAKGA